MVATNGEVLKENPKKSRPSPSLWWSSPRTSRKYDRGLEELIAPMHVPGQWKL